MSNIIKLYQLKEYKRVYIEGKYRKYYQPTKNIKGSIFKLFGKEVNGVLQAMIWAAYSNRDNFTFLDLTEEEKKDLKESTLKAGNFYR